MPDRMKGVLFTELLDWIEQRHGVVVLDEILLEAGLPHGGAYTSAGTYDWTEFAAILASACRHTGLPASEVARAYGMHLFSVFATEHGDLVARADDALSCLAMVESFIHPEVAKLYAVADLPRFLVVSSPDRITMQYESPRPTADLARGLIEGCLAHFGTSASIEQSSDGRRHRFVVERVEAPCPTTR